MVIFMETIKIIKFRPSAKLPEKANLTDAGFDCFISAFKKIDLTKKEELTFVESDSYLLKPHERVLCLLGFATEIPPNFFCQIVPRSGLALKRGLMPILGTIDSGYRNEWGAIMLNTSNEDQMLKKDDKICQFVIRWLHDLKLLEVESLSNSERGLGGFGSTDKKKT